MASTFSTNLKIELMATGENAGTWGNITNTNLGTAIEQALVGYGAVSFAADANLTITLTNSNAAQAARALVLNVTSALSLSTTRELIVPTFQKQYIVQNNTTGGQSITVKTSAGTGITVPNGRKAHLYVDGTNVIHMFDFVDINGGTIDGVTIGGGTAGAGAFTSLSATGNVTLGDASTDTVTVNGYMGVGGAANSAYALNVTSSALTGVGQWGIRSVPVATSASTSFVVGVGGTAGTAAASFTVGDVYNIYAGNSSKGAGSTITNQHGVYIADQTQGTNNYGITSLVSSGSNKWNIYASGTATNYFAGLTQYGVLGTPSSPIHILQSNAASSNANGITIEQSSTGDSQMHFLLTGTTRWTMGIDNSDSDSFKIGTNQDLGTSNVLTLTTGGAASFTGNVTLGDASTDTVTVNGYMGVGGAPSSSTAVVARSTALTSTTQTGVFSNITGTSGATSNILGFYSGLATAAAAFTAANVTGFRVDDATKGAGSTITNQYGLLVNDLTQGTNNFGVASVVSSGSNKWNIYANGTANNAFVGNVRIGSITAPTNALDVTGSMTVSGDVTLGDASTDTVRVNGYIGVGNAANSVVSFYIQGTHAGTATALYANRITQTIPATTTGSWFGFANLNSATAASAFTLANAYHYYANDLAAGAGSTITSQHGLFIADLTSATSNYGIVSQVSSGTGKWNIYASGTAANYFAGQLRLNSTTLSSIGANSAIDVSNITSDTNASWRGLSMSTVDLGASTGNVGVYLSAPYASGTVNQAFFRVKRGAGSVYNGAEIAFNGAFRFLGSTVEDASERMRIDASGNVSLGATAPTWNTAGNIVLANTRSIASIGSAISLIANGYFDTTDSRWEYASTAAATWYNQNAGQHIWYNAASGTANTALTWTQAMTLNASGNLGIQTTAPATNLHVVGTIRSAAGTGGLLQLEDTDVADASTPFWVLQSDTGTFRVFSANRSGTGTTGSVERMRIDSLGNLGLGAVPSTSWLSNFRVFQLGAGGYVSGRTNTDEIYLGTNAYFDSTDSRWEYLANDVATQYYQDAGAHVWRTAASGTAGNAITFTQSMTLDASGNLLLGRASRIITETFSSTGYGLFGGATVQGIIGDAGSGIVTLGAYSNHALEIRTNNVERLRVTTAGNVKIGGTADRATTEGTNQLVLFNGTAPVGTLTNGVSFYSATGEARVMDAAGNSTLLSPHDQSTNEWIFHSKHTPTGKVLRIDVERLLRFVNDHFGLDAVQEFIEN